jgi:hypothetical protein
MFYRPIPISWLTIAVVSQAVMLSALLLVAVITLRASVPPIVLAGALWSAYVFHRVWRGKMQNAQRGWQIAMIVAMLAQLSLFAFGCLSRAPCWELAVQPSEECLEEHQYLPISAESEYMRDRFKAEFEEAEALAAE